MIKIYKLFIQDIFDINLKYWTCVMGEKILFMIFSLIINN